MSILCPHYTSSFGFANCEFLTDQSQTRLRQQCNRFSKFTEQLSMHNTVDLDFSSIELRGTNTTKVENRIKVVDFGGPCEI